MPIIIFRLRVDLANKKPKQTNESGAPGCEKKNDKGKDGGESDDEKQSDEEGGGSRDVTNASNDTLDDIDPDPSEVCTNIRDIWSMTWISDKKVTLHNFSFNKNVSYENK